MKKIILILLLLSLSGCLGSKSVSEKEVNTKEKEKTEIKKDSSLIVSVNKGIKDRIVINVPKTDDENTRKLLDAVLKQLNTSKVSGSNSYSSRYDEETRQLVIDFIIAQTKDTETKTSSDSKKEKSFETQTDEYIKKKIIALPWWSYLLLVFVFRRSIFGFLGFFIPQIRLIKTFSDLKKNQAVKN